MTLIPCPQLDAQGLTIHILLLFKLASLDLALLFPAAIAACAAARDLLSELSSLLNPSLSPGRMKSFRVEIERTSVGSFHHVHSARQSIFSPDAPASGEMIYLL